MERISDVTKALCECVSLGLKEFTFLIFILRFFDIQHHFYSNYHRNNFK